MNRRTASMVHLLVALAVFSGSVYAESFGSKFSRCMVEESKKPNYQKEVAWPVCEEWAETEKALEDGRKPEYVAPTSPPISKSSNGVVRKEGYKPFVITSSSLNKEVTSDAVEENLMCRSTLETMESSMYLLKNFDLVESGGDSSLAITSFRGVQEGRGVTVSFMVSKDDNVLRYIWVDNISTLGCNN